MTLEHNAAADKKLGKPMQNRQIFTFFIEDMMFGLDVENVLMLGQNSNEIQRLPIEERGFCGVVKFQGVLVPVLDYAHRIGVKSGIDTKSELLDVLTEREQDHIEWMNSLEQSILTGVPFTKALDPDECAFGRWFNKFETRDEILKELVQLFEQPHRNIHGLAQKLLSLRDNDKAAEALELFHHETATTLRRLRVLFSRVRDQIQTAMRPVLVYVTRDGTTPCYALLIDEINDVITYKQNDFQSSKNGPLASIRQIENVIEGIFTKDNLPDCLYFDLTKLTDIDQLMATVS
ncbi:MAG: CZB domain-containing protein [Gammaproteobacteria bacterium]|nr:CZB domain-containing protein [Gammaproteobacteria bacterium]